MTIRHLDSVVDVYAPLATAAGRGLSPEELPRFMRSVRSVHRASPTRIECDVALGPAARHCTLTVVPERDGLHWHSDRSQGSLSLQRSDAERSSFEVHISWQPQGIAESLAALVGLDRRQLRNDLDRLRTVLESEAAEDRLQREILER